MNAIPDDCQPYELQTFRQEYKTIILEWANRWRRSENSPVPKFVQTSNEKAPIRVHFVGKPNL